MTDSLTIIIISILIIDSNYAADTHTYIHTNIHTMCVTNTYMNTYNVCDTYMGKQGARSILALVQVGLLAQASTPAVVAVALTMIMVGMVVMMVMMVMMVMVLMILHGMIMVGMIMAGMIMVVRIMAGMMWMKRREGLVQNKDDLLEILVWRKGKPH